MPADSHRGPALRAARQPAPLTGSDESQKRAVNESRRRRSPAKAKTINKYLGSDYNVIASYGHIRDLPRKDGSVRPDEDFAMSWETDPRAEKQIKAIAQAVRGADHLYLATDPDREGEAISWHIRNVLKERKVLAGMPVQRIVFNEITKSAVLDALANPRDLNDELVEAYLARRALDYLVGFTLSPVLWRKLPGSRSAGRVQSVALRLIAEREAEIEAFKAEEYWSVDVNLRTRERKSLTARLVQLDGVKLGKMDLPNQAAADAAVAALRDTEYQVLGVEKKRVRRNPAPPFTTSPCNRKPHASCASAPPAPCASPNAFMRDRPRRRDGGTDHLHANRWRANGARGGRRHPRSHRRAGRRPLPAGQTPRLQDQGQKRPRSA